MQRLFAIGEQPFFVQINISSMQKYIDMVEKALQEMTFDRQPKRLYEPVQYELSLGGKRIRPVLMLIAYNIYKENPEAIMKQALGLETYHNYTLLHDDLMDRAEIRRGKPCVHKMWDDNTAILSGDAMLVLAYHYMQQCPPEKLPQVMNLFTETALEIGEGQQYDMLFETRNDVTEEEYIEMIRLKTSVLLACALKMGALLADAPEADADALYEFGVNMGLAFQLQDDYLDVYGDPAVFGKRIGGDILCNKKTYMLINAQLRANEEQSRQLNAWLEAKDYVEEEKIAAVTGLYNQMRIADLAQEKITYYFSLAEQSLQRVSVPDEKKEILRQFASVLMKRKK